MDFLTFQVDEIDDRVCALEAMASAAAGQHAAVMAEAQTVLDWAWRRSPQGHGPVDEGMDWDHGLQVVVEDGGWHTVSLTLTGTGRFVAQFLAAVGNLRD